jgi:hypothetical protein
MSTDRPDATGLRNAGKALEDSFFARENERLLKKLRETHEFMERRQALKEAINLDEDEVIDALLKLDVKPETVAALSVVPLVQVAWADGKIQPEERQAILEAAEERGIVIGTPCHDLLESWLAARPGPELMSTWKRYAKELHDNLDPAANDELKFRLIDRARAIAQASGGIMGILKVSKEEEAVINELQHAFE